MRKWISLLLAVVSVFMLAVPAMAAKEQFKPKEPTISVPSSMEVEQGQTLDLYCQATAPNGEELYYLWYETSTGNLQDIIAINRGSETGDTLRCDTGSIGTRYYVCMVSTSTGASAYSSVIKVTVTEPALNTTIPVIFTYDSAAVVGGKLTVNIQAMTDYDARIYAAVLEHDVCYEWFIDGVTQPESSPTMEFSAVHENKECYVVVTCGDLRIRSDDYPVIRKVDPPKIATRSLPQAVAGEKYYTKLSCSDGDASFGVYYNPGRKNEFEKTGLALTQHGELEGTPKNAGTYTFTVYASGEGGEDYKEYTLTVNAPEEETTAPEETQQTTVALEETQQTTEETTQPQQTQEDTEPTIPQQPEEDNGADNSVLLIVAIVLVAVALLLVAGVVVLVLIMKKKKS